MYRDPAACLPPSRLRTQILRFAQDDIEQLFRGHDTRENTGARGQMTAPGIGSASQVIGSFFTTARMSESLARARQIDESAAP